MNPTARRVWVLLFWMAAVFGIHTSPLVRRAGSTGPAPVMDARPVSAASGEKVSLAAQERRWLSLHDETIRIGITVIPPQVLSDDGQYKGLAIDYIRLLERKLGCGFKLVPYPTWNDVIQAARVRSIDMIFAAQETPERRIYLLFTEPYLELPNMIVVRKDRQGGADLKEMSGWRVATSEGSAVHEYLKREYPDLDLLPVTDELSGLMKVSVGEADAMVVEISRASYHIEKAGILNLRVSGDAGLLYRLRFAVRSDWPVLVGILDKGLAAVTDEEKRVINRRWIVVGERRVFPGRAFWITFAVGLAVIASAVAGVVVWNRMLSRLVRQRTLQLQQELAEGEKSKYALVRMNRQLRAISTCNMVLMHALDEQTLLNDVCRIVCEEAGYRMAWVGYPQKDDARTIRPAAWAGVEEGYLAEAGITWADTEHGRGPTGRAIRAGGSVCIQDFAVDPQAAPWRESALQRGYRSSIALPLMGENGTPFGALCIYSSQPGTFTSEEMKLLDELAGNLAFGITALRVRAEHKEAERRVLAGEQLFRALVENSPDFIARYDRGFRRIYVNPAIRKLFGNQAKNIVGRTPSEQSPLYAPQVYMEHLRQAIETAAESTAEIPFRTAQGEMHWGHIRFVPELGPDGQVVSVLTIGRDIHEIKENERRFRMLAENFPDFVARFDRDGHYTFVNPAIEKAFGLPAEAIIDKSLRELPQGRRPEQNDALLALIRRAFDEGVANESEMRWDTGIGERIYEIRHAPEKDATGSVVSVLGIARDITERKQIEQERVATLRFFESMEQINRAVRENEDIEQMMSEVLDVVLSVFECDRAALVYPCDPEASEWSAPMERTKPEWPGALALGLEVPVDPEVVKVYKAVLASNDPVGFGPGNEYPLPTEVAERFTERSRLAAALYPKEDEPYMFVIHQCSRPRVWTKEERGLFKEIGKRLEDTLTRMTMHRTLLDSEERYRLVFEHSPVTIWEEDFSAIKTLFDDLKKQGLADIETHFDRHPETVRLCAESARIVDVNRAALALHGAANKEELLAGLVHTFTPESFDTFRRELVCLWNGGTEMAGDAVVKTLAGECREVTVYFSVCPGHEKTLAKVLVSLVDITERKQIEEALSASEAELRTLIKAMTDVIIVSDSEGRYLKIVDTSPSLLYKPPNELLGRTLHEVFPSDQADFFLDHIRQALGTQQSVNFEYSLPIDNKDIWFNATISPMSDDKILMVARDITERKTAEEALRRLNIELDRRVLDRTAQLEDTNKELEAFAYSVSHDLRAPLRHIDGFVELLQKKTDATRDEQSRHYMDTISDSVKKMGLLIDDLLSFSRMGRHAMLIQPLELEPLVRDVIREFEPDAAGRNIDWRIGDLPTVSGDAAMLRMVLANLISNALKFTRPRQQACIDIGTLPGQASEAVIFVRDNGVGFEMAYGDKLFGVFQRLHRADEFEGTGIGLANVRRIIARHGGRTWAEAEPDRGAVFFFSLPLAQPGDGR